MTREEIMNLDAQGVEERMAAIETEKADENIDKEKLESLTEEVRMLAKRKAEITLEVEQRKADAIQVAQGEGTMIAKVEEKKMPDLKEVRSSEAYVNAYAEYIKTNDDKEVRALLTDLVQDGTVPVPTFIDDRIATAWERSNLISRVRRTSIKGTAKYPFEFSATGAFVHTEGEPVAANTEEQLEIGTVSIEPKMLKKWITISDEVMALKGQMFLDYIYDEIEYRILLLADSQVVSAIKAAPAAATISAAGVRALTPAAFDQNTIFSALAELAPGAQNPVAIMNKKTYFNTFMALMDTTKRPIYDIVSANGRPSYYINGVEVLFDNTLTADTEVIVGDLDGVVMNLPEGREVSFVTDPYSLAEQDMVKIVGKMYAGIGVVRDGYFVKVTKA